jgi:hypothetical protein
VVKQTAKPLSVLTDAGPPGCGKVQTRLKSSVESRRNRVSTVKPPRSSGQPGPVQPREPPVTVTSEATAVCVTKAWAATAIESWVGFRERSVDYLCGAAARDC